MAPDRKCKAAEVSGQSDVPEHPPTAVVGVGASAGGLPALIRLFAHVPESNGAAWVVILHLSPQHESHLADLLRPHVKMRVEQVTGSVLLEADHVYVIPPNANLESIDTRLHLSRLEEQRGKRAPIDHFFRTLGETHDGRAIGVVLSGTGSDGSLGLKAIKESGGFTVVQDPEEAEYDGMPRNAVATGFVDEVLPLAQIPAAVLGFVRTQPRLEPPPDDPDFEAGQRRILRQIVELIHAGTGRDLRRYRLATLLRRIERRMHIRRMEDLGTYLALLRQDAGEVRSLAEDVLINVTSFFRDPQMWQALETEVIPAMFDGRGARDTVRAWCVGCASGEEAYSLAMMLMEEAERREAAPGFQVFATDLHEPSLTHARQGLYPIEVGTDLTAERLHRFFQPEEEGYRVRRQLRERVVFALHNVLADAPLSRLDVVTCRNLFIYLERDVQREVLELLHDALRPGGVLVLGSSETAEHNDLFRALGQNRQIFRRQPTRSGRSRPSVFGPHRPLAGEASRRVHAPAETLGYGPLHQRLVEQYAPPSMLVSADGRVVHLSEHAGRYLVVPGGMATTCALELVREELRSELRAALYGARETGAPARTAPILVRFNGESAQVTLDVRPAVQANEEGYALVIFDEHAVPAAAATSSATGGDADGRVQQLEADLKQSRRRLQAIVEDYENNREDMLATQEELRSANEELKSTFEELETSKEELQSMYEELETVNQENRHRVAELAQLSNDLQNLLSSTDIATLFLDRELRILRFTPRVGDLFNMRPVDRGRPVSDLTHHLGYRELQADAGQVLRTLVPVEREISDRRGQWYISRVLPYRSAEGRIEGVVITFVDVTLRKTAADEVRAAKEYAESIVATVHEPLVVLTPDLRVRSANGSFYRDFEVRREETEGRLIYELGNRQWDIPALRTLLEDVLPGSNVFNDFEVVHEFAKLGRRVMLLNARRLAEAQLILLGIRDVTERKQADDTLRTSEQRFRALANASTYAVYRMSPDWSEMRQLDGRGFIADTVAPSESWLDKYIHPDDQPMVLAAIQQAIGSRSVFELEHRVRRVDGTLGWTLSRAVPLLDRNGEISEWIGAASDTTQRVEREEALRKSEGRLKRLTDVPGVGVLIFRDDGTLLETNEAYLEMSGYTRADVESGRLTWHGMTPPEYVALSEEQLRVLDETGRIGPYEKEYLRKDGTRSWMLFAGAAQGDGTVVEYCIDVSERKRTEAELRRFSDELGRREE